MRVPDHPAAQIPLAFAEGKSLDFRLYVPGPNLEAFRCLRAVTQAGPASNIYLWGGAGTGKTHLLQAACQALSSGQKRAAYVPLSQRDVLAPEILNGLDVLDLVCLDDVHLLARDPDWELALFHLYNRMHDAGCALVLAGRTSPRALGIRLADLVSRLRGGALFHLKPLDDGSKLLALERRAEARGFDLPPEVADYLIERFPRDMAGLCRRLDELDYASLARQRKLTIPLVRALWDA